jgi:hypothetical protein
MDEQEGS